MKHPHVQHLCNIAEQQDVIYIGVTLDKIKLVLEQIAEVRAEASIRVTRGDERVTFPQGGSIHFVTPATLDKARGMSAEHIFVDHHQLLDKAEARRALAPCSHTRTNPGFERYSVIG